MITATMLEIAILLMWIGRPFIRDWSAQAFEDALTTYRQRSQAYADSEFNRINNHVL